MLEIIAVVASGIAVIVSAAWYAKSTNAGHLFFMCCFVFSSAVFTYLAVT
jgi:hypothetical protein